MWCESGVIRVIELSILVASVVSVARVIRGRVGVCGGDGSE